MQPHVPAWRRIGLKLKYAKEPAHQKYRNPESEITGASNGNHVLNETTDLDHTRPPKKRKLSPDSPTRPRTESAVSSGRHSSRTGPEESIVEPERDHDSDAEQSSRDETVEEPETSIPTITRQSLDSHRKSVTFTPETKQDDGVGASTLFKRQLKNHQTVDSEPKSVHNESTRSQIEDKHNSTKTKRSKEKQNSNLSHPNQTNETHRESKETPICLEYLQQFSADRKSWRFNKKKQTVLLKNLFNVHMILPQYNPSIVHYISGLQGEAARQRIIESATSVLRAIADQQPEVNMESMESEEARRKAYGEALKRHLQRYEQSKARLSEHDEQQLADMKHDAERGERAQAVLGELLLRELHPERYEQPKQAPPQLPQQAKMPHLNGDKKRETSVSTNSSRKTEQKRKKRKTRTTGAGEESSSLDSDSDDGNASKSRKGPTTLLEALRVTASPAPSSRSTKFSLPTTTSKPKKLIFDDDLLDKKFPRDKSYHDVAPKRKRGERSEVRGFQYIHGTKDDESGSESE